MKAVEILKNKIEKLEKSKNGISEESRREVDALINEFKLCIEEIEKIKDEAAAAADDKTIEMQTKIDELLRRFSERGQTEPAEKIEDKIKKVTNSREYVLGFYDVIKNSVNAEDFRAKYKDFAKSQFVKNGIFGNYNTQIDGFPTPEGTILPGFVVNEITDVYTTRHPLLQLVDWTGLPVYRALFEYNNEVGQVFPHVHSEEDGELFFGSWRSDTKTEQNLKFQTIDIRPAFLYKYITIDKELLRATEGQGDILLRYITRELVDRLLFTLERCILFGTDEGNFVKPQHLGTSSYEEDAETGEKIVTYLPTNVNGISATRIDSGIIAVMDTQTLAYMQNVIRLASVNTVLTISREDVAAFLQVSDIIVSEAAKNYNGKPTVIYIAPSDYKIVGDSSPAEYRDFNLSKNKEEFLTEMYVGGGCVIPGNHYWIDIQPKVKPALMAQAIRGEL